MTLRASMPTALTLANAACGMAGLALLVLADAGALPLVAGLVFLGWLFDIADGLAARLLDARSPFGQALDSLADAICFVVMPALLAAAQADGHPWVVAAAAVYFVCGLLRLARFTRDGPGDAVFAGLPSVVAAMLIAALVLFAHGPAGNGWITSQMPGSLVLAAAVLAIAVLMLSRIAYSDLPKRLLRRELPRWPFVLGGVVLALDPTRITLIGAVLAYTLGYPLRALRLRGRG